MTFHKYKSPKIAVIGLGYVGLPLAVAFSNAHHVVGFDIDSVRITELRAGLDRTLEVPSDRLRKASNIAFTCSANSLDDIDVFIVTTPTPIDDHKNPDLRSLIAATRTVGEALRPGGVVIYESTVYPGATEEQCVPLLTEISELQYNEEFFVGYSPERINPGDKVHTIDTIIKVTSGSTPECAQFVDRLYREVVKAGTHLAPSIRVAEAAKVIENIQRDVNIALMNELAVLFNHLGIDTEAVLKAAGSKWNFVDYRPGLVGGHCIGVDPYYLTYKAKQVGHNPEIILAGRRLNDSMGTYAASQMVKAMSKQKNGERRVLIMGLTFKENTPDLRNTRVVDIVSELQEYGIMVDVHDPWADPREAKEEYGLDLLVEPAAGTYDGILIAVAHRQFQAMPAESIRRLGNGPGCIIYDLKHVLGADYADLRL